MMDDITKAIHNQINGNREHLSDTIEKGAALPVGTIKKRGQNNMIKTASGWKYHSRANKSNRDKKSADGRETSQLESINVKTGEKKMITVIHGKSKHAEALADAKGKVTHAKNQSHRHRAAGAGKMVMKRLYNEIDKAERSLARIKYNQSGAQKIFKQIIPGITRSKRSSTSIRGYTVPTRGYEFGTDSAAGIATIHGYSLQQVDAIKDELVNQGFKLARGHKGTKRIEIEEYSD